MNNTPEVIEFEVGDQVISLETGLLAGQASGAVVVKSGEAMILVTATASSSTRNLDFFPLMVNYEERMYSVGRIPGSFMRREGRPSDSAVLNSRVIDRQLRPLFPDGFRNDVQVVCNPLSSNQVIQLDILAMLAASAALSISDIPFNGPTAAVRMGLIDGQWIINPTYPDMEISDLDIVVAGTEDSINMVEAGANIVSEETILEAIELAHTEIKKIIGHIKTFQEKVGKPKKEFTYYKLNDDIKAFVEKEALDKITEAMSIKDNSERKAAMRAIQDGVIETIGELPEDNEVKKLVADNPYDINHAFGKIEKAMMRAKILEEGIRIDGRDTTTVRPIASDVGMVPRTHGSGLFTRGNTQALSLLTLGSMSDAQPLDAMDPVTSIRYMHHYNFPSFSVGEVRPSRGPSRRDIGHGFLAQRALLPVIPGEDEFPYSLRVVSEILSSNGSTSMASTCASCLSMMDGGVPLKDIVGGVAMGLIKEGDNYKVLTDIQGVEDFLGDMDFKVTGTKEGVTAMQMDIKIDGLDMAIFKNALEQAREGRLHIIDKMEEAISEPREELSPYAPRIITMQIDPSKIGDVIGPGGKMIKSIVEELDVKIDIEDDGTVFIVTPDGEAADAAQEWIKRLTATAEVGKIYNGKVVRITNFGAFIEVLPNQDGLLHISKIPGRIRRVEDVLSLGDEVTVSVEEIDPQGRLNIALEQELEIPAYATQGHDDRDHRDRGRNDRGGGRGGHRGGGGGRGHRGGGGGRDHRGGGGGNRSSRSGGGYKGERGSHYSGRR